MTSGTHMLHLPFGWALLAAIISMALRDGLGTMLQIAESRGNGEWASWADAIGDLASIAFQVAGAGTVLLTGLGWQSAVVVAAIIVTSKIGTKFWTTWASKHLPEDPRFAQLRAEFAQEMADLRAELGQ